MSDFGSIVSPYQVAPARGNIQDYGQFALQQEQTDAIRVAQALAQATRAYLTQQNGLPGNIDPTAVQGYRGEDQRQMIAGQSNTRANEMEGRQAQDHQSKYDAANSFMQNYKPGPEANNPYVQGMLGGGGNPALVGPLMEFLGGDFTRQGEYKNRVAMNNDDNTAAQKRLETELTMRNDANLVTEGRKKADETGQEQKLKDALVKGQTTGDWSDFYSLAPNALGSPTMYDRENESKERVQSAEARRRQEEQDAKDLAARPSPVGQVQRATGPTPAEIPNKFFDPRVVTPRREGDSALQKGYDNLVNQSMFVPRTLYYGAHDAGYKGAELIDQWFKNFRF